MTDKQIIVFPFTIGEQDWDKELGGWRCPLLKIPGAKVTDVVVQRNSANISSYEVNYDIGIVYWKLPTPPERATIIVSLTEELSSKDLTHWWKKFAIIVPIISALLAGSLSYFSSRCADTKENPSRAHATVACDQNVKITVPVDAQHVSMWEEIKGTFQDLPSGHKIWTMVYPPTTGKFYPQNEVELIGNTWSSKVAIGLKDEAGRRFHIYVVVVDEKAHTQLSMYAKRARDLNESPGLRNLPEGARTCQFIEVVRK
jgi:hypothetical protein